MHTAYSEQIARATGADSRDVAKIESIMRDDIFHSTLDWQTEAQFSGAAVQAFELLQRHRAFYELHFSHVRSVFEEGKAEARKQKTGAALALALASGNVARIEKCRAADAKAVEEVVWSRQKREITADFARRALALAPSA